MALKRAFAVLLSLLLSGVALAQGEPPEPPEAPAPGPVLEEQPQPAEGPDLDDGGGEVKQACVSAFTGAQRLRRAGQLLATRKELITCASASCPEPLRAQCVPWLREVTAQIPSVVITARNPRGVALSRVKVEIDGEVVTSKLDGLPIEIDPGSHEFIFRRGNQPFVKRTIVVPQGAKSYPVTVQFYFDDEDPAPPAPEPQRPLPSVPTIAWVAVGVAGTGFVVGTVLGAVAAARASTIRDECGERDCTAEEIDEARGIAVGSTVSFAVAGAGLAIGLIAVLVSWPRDSNVSIAPSGLRVAF